MAQRYPRWSLPLFLLSLAIAGLVMLLSALHPTSAFMAATPQLLTDPFLQLPTSTSVRVVWFTEFLGVRHFVTYGPGLTAPSEQERDRTVTASSTQLSRTREDQKPRPGSQTADAIAELEPKHRKIWRHEAEVSGLQPGMRLPYQVTSVQEDGQAVSSRVFSLAAQPSPQMPLKILLTSDHQLKPLVSANLQKVVETVGPVDAVFFAGDLVNIPDRASEWFDDDRGGAFFPALQGRANYKLEKQGQTTVYRGGEIIQHAPLFTTIGNHEVMGRYSSETPLDSQFADAVPRAIAEVRYQAYLQSTHPADDPTARAAWIKEHSFNTDTYEEIFTLPTSETGGKTYYATTFGDIRLVVLYATNIWRAPQVDAETPGKYSEPVGQDAQQAKDLSQLNQGNWGYGQHIFEPIAKGSTQYQWLQQELSSPEFQQAAYKVVMVHHPLHSLGGNIVPPYTDPVSVVDRAADGTIQAVRYEYPQADDYLIRDVMPLLEAAGVQLVFYGHCHLWNRFVSSSGMHFLETSNVGNSYGAYSEQPRPAVPGATRDVAIGDPNGLAPIVPTIAPLQDASGRSLPYLSSNDITAFSILNTEDGTVSSYYFDTRQPQSSVVKFDEFQLQARSATQPPN